MQFPDAFPHVTTTPQGPSGGHGARHSTDSRDTAAAAPTTAQAGAGGGMAARMAARMAAKRANAPADGSDQPAASPAPPSPQPEAASASRCELLRQACLCQRLTRAYLLRCWWPRVCVAVWLFGCLQAANGETPGELK